MRRWFLIGFLVLATTAWLLGWSPYLKAKTITVDGATTISAQQIIATSGVTVGTPLARVNGARVERALTSIPRIASVTVVRGWPDRITLQVSERRPIAMVGSLGVDQEGVRFPLATGEKAPTVRINNFSVARFKSWMEIYRPLPKELKTQITDATLDGEDDIWFKTQTQTIIWGSAEETSLKLRVLKELLARPNTFSRIDLSAPLAPTTVK